MSDNVCYVASSDQYYIDYLNSIIEVIFKNHKSKNEDRIEFGQIIVENRAAILAIDNEEKQWVCFKFYGENEKLIKNPQSKELQGINNE